MVYKEFTADQVLALSFIAYGYDAVIGYKEFDKVFNILNSDLKKNNIFYYFGINMPMHDNFDPSLFREIKAGDQKGKYKMVSVFTPELKEKQMDKITNYLYVVSEHDRNLLEIYRKTLKKIRDEYNRKLELEKLREEFLQEKNLKNEGIKGKIKRFIWSKK